MTFEDLLARKPVVFDGGTGTEYQRRGLPIGIPPELWVIEKPDMVLDVHRAYINAGAQVIETCTFGANRERMHLAGIEYPIEEINRRAVELACTASGGKAVVAGSVGPIGGILEPYGDLRVADAEEIFAEQIDAQLNAGADIILVETMLSGAEALIASRIAAKLGAKTIGVTLTYEPTPLGPRTSFGESVIDIVALFKGERISFIGSNCGSGFDVMLAVAADYRAATKRPVLIQSNAGVPESESGSTIYPETPASFGQFIQTISAMGIDMIGGCCGTTPEFIAEAVRIIKK